MLKGGFVIIHRKITDWEWYKDTNTRDVFLHLILTCNHEERKFMGETIRPGERVASYAIIAEELGLSIRNVRTAIKHLKMTNEVTSRTNFQYTVFTVVNYGLYQAKRQTNRPTSDKRLTNDRQTTDNNGTKINKDINKDKQNTPAPALEARRDGGDDQIFDFTDTGRVHYDNNGGA